MYETAKKKKNKEWYFQTMMLEKTLESPLDCKKIKPVHPKGNQSWISNGRTDTEGEVPILWPPDVKNWLIWKGPDAGKYWRQEDSDFWSYRKWFHLFTIEYGVSCMFVVYGFCYVEVCAICSLFLEAVYNKWVLNFVESILCIYWGDGFYS